MTDFRPRVLVSAFSCNPERATEQGGQLFIPELAWHCDLTVLTEEVKNRAAIERRQKLDATYASIDFRYIPWPEVNAAGNRVDNCGAIHFYRRLREWEHGASAVAMRLTIEKEFDLTHHLTMGEFCEPGFLWQLPFPFIWGPTGGHAKVPWRFLPLLGWRQWLRDGLRDATNIVQQRLHPRVRAASRVAGAIVTTSSLDARAFARHQGVRAVTIPEHGTRPINRPPRKRPHGTPLRIAWSGVHATRQGLPILLEALARIPSEIPVQLEILGSGPESRSWRQLAGRLGVAPRCHWHGQLPRADACDILADCDVLAVTSLIDATGSMLHEGLSHALPVVCHEAGGIADVVNDDCAVLIPPRFPGRSIRAFTHALTRLARDPNYYNHLAEGAHARARQVTVAHRARQMLSVYERVLGRTIVQGEAAPVVLRLASA